MFVSSLTYSSCLRQPHCTDEETEVYVSTGARPGHAPRAAIRAREHRLPSQPLGLRGGVGNGAPSSVVHKQASVLRKQRIFYSFSSFYTTVTPREEGGSLVFLDPLGERITLPKRLNPNQGKGDQRLLQHVQNHMPPCANARPPCTGRLCPGCPRLSPRSAGRACVRHQAPHPTRPTSWHHGNTEHEETPGDRHHLLGRGDPPVPISLLTSLRTLGSPGSTQWLTHVPILQTGSLRTGGRQAALPLARAWSPGPAPRLTRGCPEVPSLFEGPPGPAPVGAAAAGAWAEHPALGHQGAPQHGDLTGGRDAPRGCGRRRRIRSRCPRTSLRGDRPRAPRAQLCGEGRSGVARWGRARARHRLEGWARPRAAGAPSGPRA